MKFLKKHAFKISFVIFALAANMGATVCAYIACVCAVIQMCINDNEQNFYFGLFLIPNIDLFGVTGITFLVNILLAVPFFLYFLRSKTLRAFPVATTLAMLIWEFVHIMFLDEMGGAVSVISVFISMIYCLSVTTDKKIHVRLPSTAHALSMGVLCSGGIYLLCNWEYTLDIVANVTRGQRFHAYAYDPNAFALYACLAIALVLATKKQDGIEYLFVALCSAFVLLTTSKMGVLILAALYAFSVFYSASKLERKKSRRFLVTIAILLAIAFAFFSEEISSLLENLLFRADVGDSSNTTLDGITSNRWSIAMHYFGVLATNIVCLFFGYGLSYHHHLGYGTGHQAHNTYLDIVLSWGVLGIAAFVLVLVYWAKRRKRICTLSRKKEKSPLLAYLPAFVILLGFFALSCLGATMFWWILSVAMIPIFNQGDIQDVE